VKHWKNELKRAFDVPPPQKKREFFMQLEPPAVPFYQVLLSQIGYIRKWVWCVSVLVFGLAVSVSVCLPESAVWMISALTPLLALTLITESGRSAHYGMMELEMATRFSLRSVVLARLAVLGTGDLLILAMLLPLGLWSRSAEPFSAGLYILTPFLLSTFVGLYTIRTWAGREGLYACVGESAGISFFVTFSHEIAPFIYWESCLWIWAAAALILCVGNGKQCIELLKRTEELVWS